MNASPSVNPSKRLRLVQRSQDTHWVGDGFPVRNIFGYDDLAPAISPFLLLDYSGPTRFTPTEDRRGVGEHPHRGFETVTIVYAGEVEHRDSAGGGGKIGPGDVQWMTAGNGILHEEFHSSAYGRSGGQFEIIQLWVNLPRSHKDAPPGYQSLTSAGIPRVELPGLPGSFLRIIAGAFGTGRDGEIKGPAKTYSPINLWDLELKAGHRVRLPAGRGETTALFVRHGKVLLEGEKSLGEAELGLFETEGDGVWLEASADTSALWLSGQPLGEPIVGYGPFVMCSKEEIQQAFLDFRNNRMGKIPARERS